MTAMLLMIAAEVLAGWLGFQIGKECGEAKAQSKRHVRNY